MSLTGRRDPDRLQTTVEAADRRTGRVPLVHHFMRYVFPEHWSFMWGEIALYCFVVLVATGTYLAFFFDPSYHFVVYHGAYRPLDGQKMSDAYKSVVDISWKYKAGLLMRQTHHWAADVFIAAITVHLMRVFFTGAFRKPRELIYWGGLTMLVLGVLEGYMGYSLIDDLLSGMGLAIGWAVAMSIPIVGGPFATWLWDGPFPGPTVFESRLYIAHVFIVPILIAVLLAMHLLLIILLHHTQFQGRGRRKENVVGAPTWPAYTFRSLGLFGGVSGTLFLLGGLVQINPIWLWGPYHPYIGENGAQPDWYLGWLIGALRMMPNWEPTIAGQTIVPNPFWGGAAFPLVVFGLLYAWPLLERRFSGDREVHHLLERPRDNPRRTALGVALFTFTAVPFFAGAMDRVYLRFGIPYPNALRVMQWAWIVLPPITGYAALRVCRNLRDSELRPVRGVTARMVGRVEGGGFAAGEAVLANPSWTPEAAEPDDRAPAGRAATLAQSAVERAQPELQHAQEVVRRTALSLAVLVAGTVLAVAAAAAAAVAIAAGLAAVLPTWAAVLITAAVVLLVAGALVLIARRRRAARPPG